MQDTDAGNQDRTSILFRNTFRYLVVIFAVIANLVFILCDPDGFTKRYVLLVYLFLFYSLDAMLAFLSRAEFDEVQTDCNTARRAAQYHNHTTLVSNPTIHIVGVWLLWLAGSIIFYRENINYQDFDVLAFPLFVTSAVTLVDWRPRGFFVAPFIFGVIFLLMVGFPSHSWLPQTTADGATILRVSLYFGLALMFDQRTNRGATNFQAVMDEVEQQRSQNNSGEELPDSVVFCTTLKKAEESRAYDYNRSMRIFAQSAWVLVVSGQTFLLFAVLLFLLDIGTNWFSFLNFAPRVVDRLLSLTRKSPLKDKPVLPVTTPHAEVVSLQTDAVPTPDDVPKSVLIDLDTSRTSATIDSTPVTDWGMDEVRPTSFRISDATGRASSKPEKPSHFLTPAAVNASRTLNW
jgi:hypothetical protein